LHFDDEQFASNGDTPDAVVQETFEDLKSQAMQEVQGIHDAKDFNFSDTIEQPMAGYVLHVNFTSQDMATTTPLKFPGMKKAFDTGWTLLKRRGVHGDREPSNIMMRRLDPDKLQELAQRFHDNVLAQMNEGTYEVPRMRHPFADMGVLSEEEYDKFLRAGRVDEQGYPMVNMATPYRDKDGFYSVPKVSHGDQFVVQAPNGEFYMVNSEGVGGVIDAENPYEMDVHLRGKNPNEPNATKVGMMPMGGFSIGMDNLAGLMGTEEIPLEEAIRVHNHRLDMNYADNLRAMRAMGIGGGEGKYDDAFKEMME